MTPLLGILISAAAGIVVAAVAGFSIVQVVGDGSSNQGQIQAPLVAYGSR